MSQFSRNAVGTLTVLCAVLTCLSPVAAQSVPVAAQSVPAPAPTSLRLALSTFGGYDTDVTGAAANAETAPSAPHGGAMASLEYSKRTDRITFSSGGAADTRYYLTDDPFPAASYFGSAVFGADVTSRLNVSATVDAAYSPQLVFSPLPIPGDIQTDFAPPTLDYGVAPQQMVSYAAGGNAAFRVSRRSTLSAMLGSGSQRFLDDEYPYARLAYGGGYSHSVSRYASLRLGYAQQDTDYSTFEAVPKRRYTQRTYDVGVDYSRPLSLSRRTTFSFGTGSAVLDDGVETFFNVTGSASLSHQIGRTWEANVVYARGLGTVAGFVEPTFADSVNANLQGRLDSRLTLDRYRWIREWKCRRCGGVEPLPFLSGDHSPRMDRSARQDCDLRQLLLLRVRIRRRHADSGADGEPDRSSRRSCRVDFQIPAHPRKRFSCYQVKPTHRKISSRLRHGGSGRSSFRS